jgi:hypothetical protein
MLSRISKIYPLKVWITTILVSSVILVLHAAVNNSAGLDSIPQALALFVYVSFFGLALSLPSFLLYYLLFGALKKMHLPVRLIKLYLAVSGIVTIVLTFIFFVGYGQKEFTNYQDLIIPMAYIFTLVICSWAYRIF